MAVRRLIATLLLLPALASCSDDPDSSGSGDPTSSVTPEPTPTETPPTEPAEAGDRTKAGAKAFVEYWVETLNYAASTGDTVGFSSLASDACRSCVEINDLIANTYDKGGYIRSDGWRVVKVVSVESSARRMTVQADLEFAPETIVASDGAEPQERSGSTEGATFILSWAADRWKLQQFAQGY